MAKNNEYSHTAVQTWGVYLGLLFIFGIFLYLEILMTQLIQIGKILENNNCSLNLDGDILLYSIFSDD